MIAFLLANWKIVLPALLVVGLAADELDHAGVGGVVDLEIAHEAGGSVAHRDEGGGGAGVAAGEEGDVVAGGDEGFGEPVDHAFGAAIEAGRDGFKEGGDLRDPHDGREPLAWGGGMRWKCGTIAPVSPSGGHQAAP